MREGSRSLGVEEASFFSKEGKGSLALLSQSNLQPVKTVFPWDLERTCFRLIILA